MDSCPRKGLLDGWPADLVVECHNQEPAGLHVKQFPVAPSLPFDLPAESTHGPQESLAVDLSWQHQMSTGTTRASGEAVGTWIPVVLASSR